MPVVPIMHWSFAVWEEQKLMKLSPPVLLRLHRNTPFFTKLAFSGNAQLLCPYITHDELSKEILTNSGEFTDWTGHRLLWENIGKVIFAKSGTFKIKTGSNKTCRIVESVLLEAWHLDILGNWFLIIKTRRLDQLSLPTSAGKLLRRKKQILDFSVLPGILQACQRRPHRPRDAQRLPLDDCTGRVCEGYLCQGTALEGGKGLGFNAGWRVYRRRVKVALLFKYFITLWVGLVCAGGGGCTGRAGGAET